MSARGGRGSGRTAERVCPEALLWGGTAEASGSLAGRSGTQTRTWLVHHKPEMRGRLPSLCVISFQLSRLFPVIRNPVSGSAFWRRVSAPCRPHPSPGWVSDLGAAAGAGRGGDAPASAWGLRRPPQGVSAGHGVGRCSPRGPMHSKTKQGPGGVSSGSAVTVRRPAPLEALRTSFPFSPASAQRGG